MEVGQQCARAHTDVQHGNEDVVSRERNVFPVVRSQCFLFMRVGGRVWETPPACCLVTGALHDGPTPTPTPTP